MSKLLRDPLASIALALSLALSMSSCASTGATQTGATQSGAPQAGTSRTGGANSNRMDTTEFRRPEFRTIYEAIKARRPDWLVARGGPTSFRNPTRQTPVVGVFIEGESRGYSLDKLTEFVGGDVKLIRRISGPESLSTYGSDWPWGGIVITRAR